MRLKTKKILFTEKGFSLVEIIVVLSIMSILSAITIPSFFSSMKRNRFEEMKAIFSKKISDNDWKLKDIPVSWFEKNMSYFKYFGRDMETLFSKTKIAHSRRVFCLNDNEKKILTKST